MKKISTIIIFVLALAGGDLFGQCNPDRHTVNFDDGWRSCSMSQSPNPARGSSHWIQYELDMLMEINQIHFWNCNDGDNFKSGMKDYIIDYSENGTDWTEYGQFVLGSAPGSSSYEGEAGPDLGGINAKYILITALNNHDVNNPCIGIAEVKIYVQEATVPLELVNFDVECKGNSSLVKWSVTNSLNQEVMIIERSTDAHIWLDIYEVKSSGMSMNEVYEYDYLDRTALFGTSYYRLKMIDYDGTVEYSDIGKSDCKEPKIKLDAYPIPTTNSVTIEFSSESDEQVYFELTNAMGSTVRQGYHSVFSGVSTFELDLSSLPNGMYTISLEQSGNSVQKKLIKIKD